jgi:hypothetical protein
MMAFVVHSGTAGTYLPARSPWFQGAWLESVPPSVMPTTGIAGLPWNAPARWDAMQKQYTRHALLLCALQLSEQQ